jgi:hypothetical protein
MKTTCSLLPVTVKQMYIFIYFLSFPRDSLETGVFVNTLRGTLLVLKLKICFCMLWIRLI